MTKSINNLICIIAAAQLRSLILNIEIVHVLSTAQLNHEILIAVNIDIVIAFINLVVVIDISLHF